MIVYKEYNPKSDAFGRNQGEYEPELELLGEVKTFDKARDMILKYLAEHGYKGDNLLNVHAGENRQYNLIWISASVYSPKIRRLRMENFAVGDTELCNYHLFTFSPNPYARSEI